MTNTDTTKAGERTHNYINRKTGERSKGRNVLQGERTQGKPTMSQVLHASLLDEHNEALNEISNLKHDYAIMSAQRNELLAACKALLADDDDPPGPGTRGAKLYEAARAAIAKAEGSA